MAKTGALKGLANKRWREWSKRLSARAQQDVNEIADDLADEFIHELNTSKDVPWTFGGLLGRSKHPSVKRASPPKNTEGFVKTIRVTRGVTTVIVSNEVWSEYGERLEQGDIHRGVDGQDWEPGFAFRALNRAKQTIQILRRR